MSRPPNVARVVLSGTLPGGEIWSTGFWMTDTGIHDNATAQALAIIIEGTLNASDASGAGRITATKFWNNLTAWVKVNVYFYASGGTTATYSGEYILPSPRVGTVNSGNPNQCAAVLSLRTNFAGRQNRGRMYLPATGALLQLNGQLQASDVSTVVDAWQTAFNDINASDAGKIVVVSDAGSAAHQVSLLKMDSRMDIQRSRANKQAIDNADSAVVTL